MTTDPEVRQAFIAGLRALARYLASHPDAPVPQYTARIGLCALGTDAENRRDVDTFVAAVGATDVDDRFDTDGYYTAGRMFGPIEYTATAISAARTAVYNAEQTYRGCVRPDSAPAELGKAA
jgi:hypothetical protein